MTNTKPQIKNKNRPNSNFKKYFKINLKLIIIPVLLKNYKAIVINIYFLPKIISIKLKNIPECKNMIKQLKNIQKINLIEKI